MPDNNGLKIHEDYVFFREVVNYTATMTGFNSRLIEKDYYCSLILAYFYSQIADLLVFKGGTCLSKVYAGFYRLSEDLDFVVPVNNDISRGRRRELAAEVKVAFDGICDACPAFSLKANFCGANNSTQYFGSVSYKSIITNENDEIAIEVSLREPLYCPVNSANAATLLLDPISGEKAVSGVKVACMDYIETFAEKFRAALTRREVAIRDFFDIDYAVRTLGLNVNDERLIELVRIKIAIHGNSPVNVSPERLALLKRQVDTRLKSVLTSNDFNKFDIERAEQIVIEMAGKL